MAMMHNHWIKAERESIAYFLLAALSFILASIMGLAASLKIAFLGFEVDFFPFQKLRPLHTFLSLAALFSGLMGLTAAIISSAKADSFMILRKVQFLFFCLFLGIGGLALSGGHYSGREYISWPPYISIFLLVALSLLILRIFSEHKNLTRKSPEGFWLLGTGSLFALLGLLESHLWLLPFIGNNFVRDLTVQWHGLDAFIAGMNISFYGCALFIIQKDPKPLRKTGLFAIAGFGVLFAFGHHHYASPQPSYLKVLALSASLLAVFSFLRHFRVFRSFQREGRHPDSPVGYLLHSVEMWTLVSVASGVMFAIPYLNTFVHGTYLVVVHAMGSMIGVNVMIVMAGGLAFVGREENSSDKIIMGTRLMNFSLWALWIILGGAGLMKGLLRVKEDYWVYSERIQPILYGFPIIGTILFAGVFIVCHEMIKGAACRLKDYDNLMMDKKMTFKGMGKDMPEERVVCSPP